MKFNQEVYNRKQSLKWINSIKGEKSIQAFQIAMNRISNAIDMVINPMQSLASSLKNMSKSIKIKAS